MKRKYETPEVEKMEFCYREQIVASAGEQTEGGSRASMGGSASWGCGVSQALEGLIGDYCSWIPFNVRDRG